MSGWLLWLGALAVMAAVLTWSLNRELDRIERERRLREWLATSATLARLKVNVAEMHRQVGVALIPSIQRLARAIHDAQPSVAAFAAAIGTAEPTNPDPQPTTEDA